ncbi:hypothetical protein C0068_18565 [Zhongshania marina]|uniref:Uncharacterized protein n=1 Tax=Zhongshania marina TaxID=2304603 RepID=A0A2S4HBT2_9GAMM|nr:hypothetical protein C0068_18565 [Marortus luteolus]
MQKLGASTLSAYGFFFGTQYVVQNITGYLSTDDYPIVFVTLLHPLIYVGLFLSGLLLLAGKRWAKHVALVSFFGWLYFQFVPLMWPINTPEMQERLLGQAGIAAWKRSIDIVGIGIIHGVALSLVVAMAYGKGLTSR